MALYAIGDLHLSFGSDKPMDVFGGGWTNYTDKIKDGFAGLDSDDVCVLCGDISWGMSLKESLEDFIFIDRLPGKKIILKGNHDYWWTTVSKMNSFFAGHGISSIEILNNNCFFYNETAICGTRGWITDDEFDAEHNTKVMARETARLRASLQAGGDAEVKLCFFHYPPRFRNMICKDMIDVMYEFGVLNCWYGHLHGAGHRFAERGEIGGITYDLVSADFLDFSPLRIL